MAGDNNECNIKKLLINFFKRFKIKSTCNSNCCVKVDLETINKEKDIKEKNIVEVTNVIIEEN